MGKSAATTVAKPKADAVCPEGKELEVGMRASRVGVPVDRLGRLRGSSA